MERDPGARPGGAGVSMEQLYRQLLRLSAGLEEVKTAVRAIRRRLDEEAAERRAANGGEGNV